MKSFLSLFCSVTLLSVAVGSPDPLLQQSKLACTEGTECFHQSAKGFSVLQKKAVKGRTDLQEESEDDPEIHKSNASMEEIAETRPTTEFDSSGPTVAALIAVHPPKFDFLLKFLMQWSDCSEAQSAVTLMPVFSNTQDQESFHQLAEGAGFDSLYTPLVAQPLPAGAKPTSWKKLDGLANILENFPEDQFEFALLLDSEIAIARCEGFGRLPGILQKKHEGKNWFAIKGATPVEAPPVEEKKKDSKRYAYTVEMVNEFAAKSVALDATQVMLLKTLTGNFSSYSWWSDLPYVHLRTARRMFSKWSQMLQVPLGSTSGKHSTLLISTNMTTTSDVPQLQNAGVAFEHITYQYYCILHEGFSIVDVLSSVHWSSEKFWFWNVAEKATFVSTVEPNWLPAPPDCQDLASKVSDVFLIYHTDRCHGGWPNKQEVKNLFYDRQPADVPFAISLSNEELEQLDHLTQQSWCAKPHKEQTQYSMVWHEVLPHLRSALQELQLVNFDSSAAYMFGVAQGDGMPLVRKLFPESFLYGFDSFEGLPEETHAKSQIIGWTAGLFKAQYNEQKMLERAGGASSAKLIRGFYNESLTRRLAIDNGMSPAFYVDIDCDLQVSTHDALDWLFANQIAQVGTLVGYDDWWTIPCFKFHHNTNSSYETRLSTNGAQEVTSPLSVGEGLAHVQIAQKYGVHFKCVAGPCKLTPRSFSECHINNNWGPVFLVTAIGDAQGQHGFEFTPETEREWMEGMKVCRTVG